MEKTQWVNPYNPQTLQIANFLLYINAFWIIIFAFGGGGGIVFLIAVAAIAVHIYGGWGIANRKKLGYVAATVAAFLPMGLRLVSGLLAENVSLTRALLETPGLQLLRTQEIIGYMFEIALIALLVHPESRNYQKLWFD